MFSQGLLETWSDHLRDLKKTIFRVLLLWLIATVISFIFNAKIFELILLPIQSTPLAKQELLLLTPTDGIVAVLKVVTTSGLVLSLPFILIVLWQFISPGLKSNERRFLSIYVMAITMVVYASIVYGFFLMLPLSLSFLVSISPAGVTSMLTLLEYLNFVAFLLFGIIILFQLPILIFSLIATGLLQSHWLESKRREIYIVLMIIIAIVTPPDVFTFFVLGLPVLILFEISIILAKLFVKQNQKKISEGQ